MVNAMATIGFMRHLMDRRLFHDYDCSRRLMTTAQVGNRRCVVMFGNGGSAILNNACMSRARSRTRLPI
jgi:hypothetical protein